MILSSSERAWNADPPASGGERWLCLGDDLFAIRAESVIEEIRFITTFILNWDEATI